jgi:hypothetical protein
MASGELRQTLLAAPRHPARGYLGDASERAGLVATLNSSLRGVASAHVQAGANDLGTSRRISRTSRAFPRHTSRQRVVVCFDPVEGPGFSLPRGLFGDDHLPSSSRPGRSPCRALASSSSRTSSRSTSRHLAVPGYVAGRGFAFHYAHSLTVSGGRR